MSEQNLRLLKGQAICNKPDQIKQIDAHTFKVHSQTNGNQYVVTNYKEWDCTCPDHVYREVKCKHIWAVELRLQLRKAVESRTIEPLTDTHSCIFCGSNRIVRDGIRHNMSGGIQKFNCKDCGHYFTINIGFEKMRATPHAITSAMQLFFTGESLRNVQRFLRLQGVNVSHVAVYKWIKKYIKLMERYLDQIKPQVSNTWRADELYVKIKGDMKYLFALMDDETRFLIAQEVADSKHKYNAESLFRKGKEAIGRKPDVLITDGLHSYHLAYKREFWTQRNPRTKHVNSIKFDSELNNNKMERLNGEIRDREKILRGLKKNNSPILTGYQIFHNYIREHEGLKGKTPAEKCGIEVKGRNKWLTLIQNACKS